MAKTLEMNDRLNIDIDAAGNIMGIEILDASSQENFVGTLQKNVAGGVLIEIIASTPNTA